MSDKRKIEVGALIGIGFKGKKYYHGEPSIWTALIIERSMSCGADCWKILDYKGESCILPDDIMDRFEVLS